MFRTFCSNALLGSGSDSILVVKTLADKSNLCGGESSLTIANVILIKLNIKSKLVNFSSSLCGNRNRTGEYFACYIRSAISTSKSNSFLKKFNIFSLKFSYLKRSQ